MAMLMFHARQPFYSPGSLHGLYNQIAFLRQAGAVTVQCMAHTPARGTRELPRTRSPAGASSPGSAAARCRTWSRTETTSS